MAPLPNTRMQRTRSSPSALRSPLMRCPLGAAVQLTLSVLITFGAAARLPACECVVFPRNIPEVDGYLKQGEMALILGRIREVTPLDPSWAAANPGLRPMSDTRAIVQVDRYWGRAAVTSILSIETTSDCGVDWRVGDCYLLDAWLQDGGWQTGHCGMTSLTEGERDPRFQLPHEEPVPSTLEWLTTNVGAGTVPGR